MSPRERAGVGKVGTPAARREAVANRKALLGFLERRACRIAGADRKVIRYMLRYRAQRAPDTVLPGRLRGLLRELASECRRLGDQNLFALLCREGEPFGVTRIYRLYREERLTVRNGRARDKAGGTRAPIPVEARADARWPLDLASRTFGSSTSSSQAARLPGSQRGRTLPAAQRDHVPEPRSRAAHDCRLGR